MMFLRQRNRAAEIWCRRRTMLSKERCRSRRGVGDRHFAEVDFGAVVRQLDRIDPTYRD